MRTDLGFRTHSIFQSLSCSSGTWATSLPEAKGKEPVSVKRSPAAQSSCRPTGVPTGPHGAPVTATHSNKSVCAEPWVSHYIPVTLQRQGNISSLRWGMTIQTSRPTRTLRLRPDLSQDILPTPVSPNSRIRMIERFPWAAPQGQAEPEATSGISARDVNSSTL